MNIINNSIVRALWALMKDGYLKEKGWFRSFSARSAINSLGEPIPWINYPMVQFLTERLPNNISCLEYGSGNSTLFWATKVKMIVSVEHDTLWADYISKKFSNFSNIQLLQTENNEYYETAPLKLNTKFQLIIVDGIRRLECISVAQQLLREEGCILVDDTHFSKHKEIFTSMKKYGFKELRISGPKPIQNDYSEATLFYRTNNFLNL